MTPEQVSAVIRAAARDELPEAPRGFEKIARAADHEMLEVLAEDLVIRELEAAT